MFTVLQIAIVVGAVVVLYRSIRGTSRRPRRGTTPPMDSGYAGPVSSDPGSPDSGSGSE